MPRYTREQHGRAWEIWYETRNTSEVCRQIGCNYSTAQRWQTPDFRCQDGCPFHGYEELLVQRDAALSARYQALQQGEVDPVQLEMTMREATEDKEFRVTTQRIGYGPVMQRVMSDLERAGIWAFLFRKVFFDLTGIALTPQQLDNPDAHHLAVEEAKSAYLRGLRATNAESAMRMLKMCEQQMDRLYGIKRDEPPEEKKADNTGPTINIRQLMILHQKIEQNPEELGPLLEAAKITNSGEATISTT